MVHSWVPSSVPTHLCIHHAHAHADSSSCRMHLPHVYPLARQLPDHSPVDAGGLGAAWLRLAAAAAARPPKRQNTASPWCMRLPIRLHCRTLVHLHTCIARRGLLRELERSTPPTPNALAQCWPTPTASFHSASEGTYQAPCQVQLSVQLLKHSPGLSRPTNALALSWHATCVTSCVVVIV